MLDAGIQSEAQSRAAADAGDATGPGNDGESERPHAAEPEGVRPFARARLRLGAGLELKAPVEVMGEDAQLLPGAIGAVVVRGDDVQGELPLQLARERAEG